MKKNDKGFSLVELLIVVAIIGIIAAIAIPSLLAARRASNESAAVGNLRTIGSAEATYLSQTGNSATFSQLVASSMLDNQWATGVTRDSYVFDEQAGTGVNGTFFFTAEPTSTSNGSKSYSIIEDYVIRYVDGQAFGSGSGGGTAIGVNP